jgi:hypothetical protein
MTQVNTGGGELLLVIMPAYNFLRFRMVSM